MREHAHRLLDQLEPSQLAAIVHLLETIVPSTQDDSDTLSSAERKAIAEADAWLAAGNTPIPNEQMLAEFGLTMTDWEKMANEPIAEKR